MASDLNLIQKSGAWFSVDGERIGQGRDNARTYLEQHPDLMGKIERQLLTQAGIQGGRPDKAVAGAAPGAASAPEGQKPGKAEAEAGKPQTNGNASKPVRTPPARPS